MTPKQERFVEEYLVDLNGTQAAIRAGYSARTANEQAVRILADVSVQKRLTERMQARAERTEITQDRVLKELGRLAFLDIRKAFDATGNLKPVHELDDETAAAIAGLEVSEITAGEVTIGNLKKIKLSDKKGALELIGRHLRMWNDKLDLNNNITVADSIRRALTE